MRMIDLDEAVFTEPWEAHAFSLAVKLSELGYFAWQEWVDVLTCHIKAASEDGHMEDGSRYYDCWLAALEEIVLSKKLATNSELLSRKDAWIRAYIETPHGHPVELSQVR